MIDSGINSKGMSHDISSSACDACCTSDNTVNAFNITQPPSKVVETVGDSDPDVADAGRAACEATDDDPHGLNLGRAAYELNCLSV